MPPWHFLLHAPHLGLGAGVGGIVGGFLAWPEPVYRTLSTGLLSGHLVEYHTRLGVTSLDSGRAWTVTFIAIVVGIALGVAVGGILVSLGILKKEDLKID